MKDLEIMHKYDMQWCLKPIPQKSEVSAFHVTNKLAQRELDVAFNGEKVRHS